MSSKLPDVGPEPQAAAGTQPPVTSTDPNAEASRPSVGGTVPAAAAGRRLGGLDWRQYVVYIGFVLVFIIFAIFLSDSGFLTTGNLLNIVRQTAIISVMAVAVTFVIGAAEIDLSVGSLAGLASVMSAMAIGWFAGGGTAAAVIGGFVVGLLTGVVVGTINGLLVTLVGIPSFLVTLGMLGIANGTAQWVTSTAPVPIENDVFNWIFGSGNISIGSLQIPVLLFWTLLLVVVGHIVLRKTPYGRQVLATGGNESAARFSGVKTLRIKFMVMMVSGTVAALAGMLYAGRLHSGRFTFGQGDELSVIAAVILGGTSLFGGNASVIGSLIGSLMIGVINNGLILWGLEVSQQQIIRGAIIILAVALARKRPGA